ncbi:MAG: prepilin-type N-terminal cleavage/methylation domain-containing protein [Elusimicrobiota bacterium]
MRQGQAGFTLVELLVAVAIFAMVVAGMAVIYSTAFKQGTGLLTDTRLKANSAVAMRAIQSELAQATRLQLPLPNSSGKHLRGWTNVSPDVGPDGSTPVKLAMDNVVADRHWFHFCLQEGSAGGCNTTQNPVSCLFYYRGPDGAAWASTWGITDANCGTTVGGVAPDLLASSIVGFVANAPVAEGYFTRTSGSGVSEGNQVRVSFQMRQFATPNSPPVEFTTDSTYSVQFAP